MTKIPKEHWDEVVSNYNSIWGSGLLFSNKILLVISVISSIFLLLYSASSVLGYVLKFTAFLVLYYSAGTLWERNGHWSGYVDGYSHGFDDSSNQEP